MPSRRLPPSSEQTIRRINEQFERRLNRQGNSNPVASLNKCENNSVPKASINEQRKVSSENRNTHLMHHNYNIEHCTKEQANKCLCTLVHLCGEKGILSNEKTSSDPCSKDQNQRFLIKINPLPVEPNVMNNQLQAVKKIAPPVAQPTGCLQVIMEEGVDCTKIKLKPKDVGVQVDTKYRFFKLIKNRDQLSTATGIDSFETLNDIVEKVKQETNSKHEKSSNKMKTEDRVVLTYVKLKQNLSYSFLAIIFDCVTSQQVGKIYLETMEILNKLGLAEQTPSVRASSVKDSSTIK